MASPLPAGMMAAFALMRPSREYAVAVLGMLQPPSGMVKSRDVWPCSAGPPNGPGAKRVSTTRQGCTATNCSGTCAKASGETVNKANNKANPTTTDKKTWRMECMEFLLKLAKGLANGGSTVVGGPTRIIVSVRPRRCQQFHGKLGFQFP